MNTLPSPRACVDAAELLGEDVTRSILGTPWLSDAEPDALRALVAAADTKLGL